MMRVKINNFNINFNIIQTFSVGFSNHDSKIGPFDNWTCLDHLNTRFFQMVNVRFFIIIYRNTSVFTVRISLTRNNCLKTIWTTYTMTPRQIIWSRSTTMVLVAAASAAELARNLRKPKFETLRARENRGPVYDHR